MKKNLELIIIAIFIMFFLFSSIINFNPGIQIRDNFINFLVQMIKIVPLTFILIGLFEVWVKRESVEKHLGNESGLLGYLWIIALAGTTVGGLYVAFPVAAALTRKGAGLKIIFTYLGAAAVCRIPMTFFEANFLGLKFTLIRLCVSIPLIILSSIILTRILGDEFKISG